MSVRLQFMRRSNCRDGLEHDNNKGNIDQRNKTFCKNNYKEKILHSVLDFTVRLRLIQKSGGNYIR